MSHGDLIPGNVLVNDGRLVGILDCGGFGPADPALDLVAAFGGLVAVGVGPACGGSHHSRQPAL